MMPGPFRRNLSSHNRCKSAANHRGSHIYVNDEPANRGESGCDVVLYTVPDGGHGPDETLAKAGISVRTLSRRNAGGGAAGDALQITVQHPIPGSNAKGTLVYEFAGAIALPLAETWKRAAAGVVNVRFSISPVGPPPTSVDIQYMYGDQNASPVIRQ